MHYLASPLGCTQAKAYLHVKGRNNGIVEFEPFAVAISRTDIAVIVTRVGRAHVHNYSGQIVEVVLLRLFVLMSLGIVITSLWSITPGTTIRSTVKLDSVLNGECRMAFKYSSLSSIQPNSWKTTSALNLDASFEQGPYWKKQIITRMALRALEGHKKPD